VYRKSLLYLVSKAFEHNSEEPLIGMEKFKDKVSRVNDQPTFFTPTVYRATRRAAKPTAGSISMSGP
jgi:hypothetical protein